MIKSLLAYFLVFLSFSITCSAQGDSLSIKLKNGEIVNIALEQIQKIQFEDAVGVDEKGNSNKLQILGNYPNPVQDETNIEFEIPSNGNVMVVIYDSEGKIVQQLECLNCNAGKNTLSWNCTNKDNTKVNSGIYYYEVHYNNEIQSKKMIIIK